MSRQIFPSYISASFINIGDFIQRIEAIISFNFIFAGFVKICICLLVAVKGFCKVFGLKEYKLMVAPLGLAMMTLACIIYTGTGEMLDWRIQNLYVLCLSLSGNNTCDSSYRC